RLLPQHTRNLFQPARTTLPLFYAPSCPDNPTQHLHCFTHLLVLTTLHSTSTVSHLLVLTTLHSTSTVSHRLVLTTLHSTSTDSHLLVLTTLHSTSTDSHLAIMYTGHYPFGVTAGEASKALSQDSSFLTLMS
ncbi:hypothetical protein BgiBS90_026784, partial [Biomphalaria glabrata]